jgi:pimeloyl-ACP methyl ester carboxylesterase
MFPANAGENGNADGYKYLFEDTVAYTDVLEAMVAALEADTGHKFGPALFFGISGGAQFAHRYAIVRPENVAAASIAAPGSVTLPGRSESWWTGTGDLADRFGRPLDLDALRTVKFHLCVGSLDLDTSEILPERRSHPDYQIEGAALAGKTRVDRLLSLAKTLSELGIPCETEIVSGASHQLDPLLHRAKRFFERLPPQSSY